MKPSNLSHAAGAALAAVLLAFTAAPSFANEAEVMLAPGSSDFQPYNSAPAADGYKIFVTGEAPASTPDIADDSYGSQGFHHGLPETSIIPNTEPVADVTPAYDFTPYNSGPLPTGYEAFVTSGAIAETD